MARIAILQEDDLNEAQQRVLDEIKESRDGTVIDLFKVLLHSPIVADHAQKLGAFHRHHSSLSTRLVEISVLTTAQHWNCAYAWHYHDCYARACGIDDEIIQAIRQGQKPILSSPNDVAVYRFTRELLEVRYVCDEIYQTAHLQLGDTGVIDLTALIGYYTMIMMSLNTHQVPLPEGAIPALYAPG